MVTSVAVLALLYSLALAVSWQTFSRGLKQKTDLLPVTMGPCLLAMGLVLATCPFLVADWCWQLLEPLLAPRAFPDIPGELHLSVAGATLLLSAIGVFVAEKCSAPGNGDETVTSPTGLGSLYIACILSYQTLIYGMCIGGHLDAPTLLGSVPAASLAWYSFTRNRRRHRVSQVLAGLAIVFTTGVLFKNLLDALWLGHDALPP